MQHRPGLTRVLGASLAAWIAICGFAASHATADANDTSAGASGPLLHGVFWAGSIGTENDLDWYVLYSGASTELGVHLNGQGPDDCFGQVMELTDGDGRFLAGHGGSIDRSETGHILYTVDIGTYYVKVRPNNVAPCIGPDAKYTLWVTASPQLLTAPPPLPPAPPPSIAAPAPTTQTTGVRPGAVRGGTKPSFACRPGAYMGPATTATETTGAAAPPGCAAAPARLTSIPPEASAQPRSTTVLRGVEGATR